MPTSSFDAAKDSAVALSDCVAARSPIVRTGPFVGLEGDRVDLGARSHSVALNLFISV